MVLQIRYRQKPLRDFSKGLLLTANRYENVPGTKWMETVHASVAFSIKAEKSCLKGERATNTVCGPGSEKYPVAKNGDASANGVTTLIVLYTTRKSLYKLL